MSTTSSPTTRAGRTDPRGTAPSGAALAAESAQASAPVRRRLLDAAADLFYAQGMAATGIGAVLERAGVARRSLYQHFGSKDALVEAWIQERHEEWLDLYRAREAALPEAGDRWRQGVLAVFDAYADHAVSGLRGSFRGCGLLNAAAELPTGTAGRTAVREHKQQVEQILREWLDRALPDERARSLARHLSYLLEGAMVRAGLEGDVARIRESRVLAESLLAAIA